MFAHSHGLHIFPFVKYSLNIPKYLSQIIAVVLLTLSSSKAKMVMVHNGGERIGTPASPFTHGESASFAHF